jgi:hypothetical protein
MVNNFLRFSGCCVLGLMLALLLLVALLFAGQFELIKLLQLSGQPLAELALLLLPDALWDSLSGTLNTAHNPHVQSFLGLCTALGQLGLLLAMLVYRLCARA